MTLTQKTCEVQTDGDPKVVQTKSVFSELWTDVAARDEMIKIGRMYDRYSIFTEFASQETFKEAIGRRTPTLIQELSHCFQSTFRTRLIAQSEWPEDQEFYSAMI